MITILHAETIRHHQLGKFLSGHGQCWKSTEDWSGGVVYRHQSHYRQVAGKVLCFFRPFSVLKLGVKK